MSIADALGSVQAIQSRIAVLVPTSTPATTASAFSNALSSSLTSSSGTASNLSPASLLASDPATPDSSTLDPGIAAALGLATGTPVAPTTTATTTPVTSTPVIGIPVASTPVTSAPVDPTLPTDAGPSPYDDLIVQAANANGVDPALLKALVRSESNFNPNAVSSAGAQGLTQLMPSTAAGFGVANSFDPLQSLMGGARYLHNALEQFDGNESLALAAYNAGGGAVQKYGGIPPYPETQAYVPKVLGYADAYRAQGFGGTAAATTTTTPSAIAPVATSAVAAQAAVGASAASPAALQALANAAQHVGEPYVWGGESPETGFDCSGIAQWAYGQVGVSLPRVAADQANAGVPVSKDQPAPGDLVFFADDSGYVHHEGIYVGGGRFLHAPHTGDVVKVSSLSDPYYAKQFSGARRVA